MRFALLLCSLAVAAALTPVGAPPANAGPPVTVKPGASEYGRILVDSKGFALYAFTRDGRAPSRCSGECARAWPPYIARGALAQGAGTSAGRLGVARRADGRRQVTFDGRPLYYYVGDRRPGQVLCQNVSEYGGLWLILRPSGRLVR